MMAQIPKSMNDFKNACVFPAGDPGPCAICKERYSFKDCPARIRPCGHVFGKVCLDKWLERKNTCPSCKRLLFSRTDSRNAAGSRKNSGPKRAAVAPKLVVTNGCAYVDSSTSEASDTPHCEETMEARNEEGLFVRSKSRSKSTFTSFTSSGSLSSTRSLARFSIKVSNDLSCEEARVLWRDFDWSYEYHIDHTITVDQHPSLASTIDLDEDEDAPFSTMAPLERVWVSPHGPSFGEQDPATSIFTRWRAASDDEMVAQAMKPKKKTRLLKAITQRVAGKLSNPFKTQRTTPAVKPLATRSRAFIY